MNVSVISEYQEPTKRWSDWLAKDYAIAQDIWEHKIASEPEFNKPLRSTEWFLILRRKTDVVMFELKAGYQETMSKLYGALKAGKPCIVWYNNYKYVIPSLTNPDIDKARFINPEAKDIHPMYAQLQMDIREAKQIYAERMQAHKEYSLVLEMYQNTEYSIPTEDELMNVLLNNAYAFDIKVNYLSDVSKHQAYIQIQYYKQYNLAPVQDNLITCKCCGNHIVPETDNEYLTCPVCGMNVDYAELPEEQLVVTYYGNQKYLVDIAYQEGTY